MPETDLLDLPDPVQKKNECFELLITTNTDVMDDLVKVEEKLQLINWVAYVRDKGMVIKFYKWFITVNENVESPVKALNDAWKEGSISLPVAKDPNTALANKKYHELVENFLASVTKTEAKELIDQVDSGAGDEQIPR